jgi:hypothetical protein
MMTELQEKVAWQVLHLVTEIQVQPVTSPLRTIQLFWWFFLLLALYSISLNYKYCSMQATSLSGHVSCLYKEGFFFYDKF